MKQTDNPGPWLLHCHIDWHLQTGLAVVFAEDAPDVKTNVPVPGESVDWKCSVILMNGYRRVEAVVPNVRPRNAY